MFQQNWHFQPGSGSGSGSGPKSRIRIRSKIDRIRNTAGSYLITKLAIPGARADPGRSEPESVCKGPGFWSRHVLGRLRLQVFFFPEQAPAPVKREHNSVFFLNCS